MDDKKIPLEDLLAYGSKEAVAENLRDAGCCPETIDCCLACLDSGKKAELLRRLDEHRQGLLDKVHQGQRQIDCLDYLVYQLHRCEKNHD